MASAWLLGTGLLAVWSQTWPALRYRHTAYSVSDDAIRIRSGVIWRAVHTVPRSRVQHTDVSQGPVQRAFDLATLTIYTAGTQYASVSLDGLTHPLALAVRDHLIVGGSDDAV